MRRFAVVVEPFGSLFVGGYAQASGGADADTAADPLGLLLPGSAVKGALRESTVRLVKALGRGDELRRRLFGEVDQPGLLRCGPLRPRLPDARAETVAELPGSVRNHVSLERATRQAAPHRLFQHRVTPALPALRFEGVLEASEELSEDELGLLRCAAQITDQIGGGRGRGLGLVTVSVIEAVAAADAPAAEQGEDAAQVPTDPAAGAGGARSLVLCLEAQEPLHLAGVKDLTNYAPSRDYVDGSALRGAVAAALAGDADVATLEELLGPEHPAMFGDARPGDPGAVPAPLTLRVPKRGGPPLDEAARLCAEACGGRTGARREDTRATRGTFVPTAAGWSAVALPRRTITRTARDAASGRTAHGKLFSLEVLDPAAGGAGGAGEAGAGGASLRFHAPVSGTAEQLALVLEAARRGLVVGGERSYGCGRLRLVSATQEAPLPPCAVRHGAWARLVGSLAVAAPEATGVLLALGPLAVTQERLVAALRAVGLELREGVARRQAHGGWNARLRLPRTLSSHFVPGSTFVVARANGRSALDALVEIEAAGVGPGRADGWGRLAACHPIHVDCHQEE
jgi:RAMP superfamily